MGHKRVCPECGIEFQLTKPQRVSRTFCSTECRLAFNNRRQSRGAELYDLFMALRYERGVAKARGYWTLICKMGHWWREADFRERGGRPSWIVGSNDSGRYAQYRAVVLVGSARRVMPNQAGGEEQKQAA